MTVDDLALGDGRGRGEARLRLSWSWRSAWQRLAALLGGDADESSPRRRGRAGVPTVDFASIRASVPLTPPKPTGARSAAQANAPVAIAAARSGDAVQPLVGMAVATAPEVRHR